LSKAKNRNKIMTLNIDETSVVNRSKQLEILFQQNLFSTGFIAEPSTTTNMAIGVYYKLMTIVNDDSRDINKLEA
jgi:hypothetical protein